MDDAQAIADRFLLARRNSRYLKAFPGAQPATLADAYRVQERMLAGYPVEPVGWKVGSIAPRMAAILGADRLVGPIVNLAHAPAGVMVEAPLISGGFGAVEAEIALLIGSDIPAQREPPVMAELAAHVASTHIAAEIAGSPLATIVDLGPTAVISDHGNNLAVVIGDTIPNGLAQSLDSLTCTVSIDQAAIASGSAGQVPGGPLAALSFLVQQLATRGRSLKRGDWVSTGAMTGVHSVAPGMQAELDFGAHGRIPIRFVQATTGH
ncbi:2-keto-4-pentenoate hydratase [Devosia faecipullorum]|uniref:2-keto-4-pentenoate hydratase n=1 Tax=Devosia faecipullorum TaxID=2755039 RepID=UPI00187B3051|nr:2-keto-4-pentenoate hydratase [Devosia faecipullorum]MBE7734080.1 2-keto-4-pentenoate hydratase [Devosia faecipullorum]